MALFSYDKEAALPRMREVAVDFSTGQPLMDESGEFRYVRAGSGAGVGLAGAAA